MPKKTVIEKAAKAVGVERLVSRRSIELGAMSPKLSIQLKGMRIPKDKLRTLDKLAEARTWCYLHGLITESESRRAAMKLIGKVQDEVRKASAANALAQPIRDEKPNQGDK